MVTFRTALIAPFFLLAALSLSSCAAESPVAKGPDEVSTTEPSESAESAESTTDSSAIDADGFVIPGSVVELQLGDSVSYYSYPKLSTDDAQKVTIHSVDYVEAADLPAGAPSDVGDGVLVIELTWETLLGDTQSNQGYLIAALDSGEKGKALAFMENRLRNGGVDLGEPRSGVFTIAIPRGVTTLTLVDYVDVPVATLTVDTSR